jgi:hypothetical protein
VLGASAAPAGAEDPGASGFYHDVAFVNDSAFPADGLTATLSDYTWQIDLISQPDRCPEPDIDSGGGFSANLDWDTSCLWPGESVTLRLNGECDECPPPDTTNTWVHEWLGDADCSAVRDAVDAALVLQFRAGLIAGVACTLNADFNGDGEVTAVDALLILQLVAGLITL